MATLPGASTRIVDTASAAGGGDRLICVLSPVPSNDDGVPRLFGSAQAIYETHGYCPGVEYAALHASFTGLPIFFIGAPIATPGEVTAEVTTGNSGTSVTTLAEGADGVLAEHDGVIEVVRGGTIGASQIVLRYSLDGATSWQQHRLGTGNSFSIPYVGVTVAFAAGTLVAGDRIHTWKGTAPLSDATGWATAFDNLKAQQKLFRSVLLCGELQDATESAAFLALVNAYETADERFIYARADVPDRPSGTTKAVWMAGLEATFEAIDGQPRISLSAGRGRVPSPFSGWQYRQPSGWAASLREYQHDLHVPPWRKDFGPVGFSLWDASGNLVEWDDRVDGGAGSAAKFTTLRSWSNGPGGAFVALSLTRASDASVLGRTENLAVACFAQTLVQQATENSIGRNLDLNDDGTATSSDISNIENEVNTVLANGLLRNARNEGRRASSAVWTMDPTTVFNVPEPILTGVLELNLRGVIYRVLTSVRVK